MAETLLIKNENDVLRVTLNRPNVHNAFNPEMIAELTRLFKSTQKDTKIRALVLSGAGQSFCAGGDLNWMKSMADFTLKQNRADSKKLADMFEAAFLCPVPVIGNIHGSVMGGGVGLVAICDLAAADPGTKFSLSEVKLGLVPSVISPYVLRKIPESQARGLMLTAEIFSAEKAFQVGLLHKVGGESERHEFIEFQLKLIRGNGPEAVRATKGLIQKIKTSNFKQAQDLTIKTIAARRVSKEGQEGMKAFFEKRSPSWKKS